MKLFWQPGERIKKLPKIFWYPAIFLKNLFHLIGFSSLITKPSFALRETEIKLVLGVEYIYGCLVDGDVAEFGTASGGSASIIAKAMKRMDKTGQKNFYLFDSFKGLPKSDLEADKNSPMVKSGDWAEGVFSWLNAEELKKKISKYLPVEKIKIYEGWFSDTLRQLPTETKFAMIHIDSDLYSSAIDILDYIFNHGIVQDGTIIFFDDYNGNHASPHYGERKAWNEVVAKYSVEYSDAGDYGSGSKKFIIHSYKTYA
jgi:hypothetical protein